MRKVSIKKLKAKLAKRNDNGTSKRFMEMFGKLTEDYLDYMDWVDGIIKKNGDYQGYKTKEEVIKGFKSYIDLIEDIREHGVKNPILLHEDECGIEIDGYHRLIISEKLGKKHVPISDGTSR